MGPNAQGSPANLNQWFESVLSLAENSLFSIAPEGPHRDAVVLDALIRNARIIHQAQLDNDGKLYSAVCFFLSAACRQLGTRLGVRHWRSALDNVRDLRKQLMRLQGDSDNVGLPTGSPAIIFKAEFDEAVRQAGLLDGTSFLSKQDRQVALGLAINWGMRLLLAYALELPLPPHQSGRRDLAWLAEQVRSSVAEAA